MYRVLFFIATIGGLVGCTLFVIRYHLRTKGSWRKTEVGRFFVVVYVNVAALFVYLLASPFMGDWRRWIALTLYTAYALETWWPLRLLHKYRKSDD